MKSEQEIKKEMERLLNQVVTPEIFFIKQKRKEIIFAIEYLDWVLSDSPTPNN